MSSVIKRCAIRCCAVLFASGAGMLLASQAELRVCADPGNLPYSNEKGEGFENKLADLLARDLGMEVTYTWFRQGGNFFRKTLNAKACDVVMGVPAGMPNVGSTQPYYRSGYAFVSRRGRELPVHSLDDPRLRRLRIGVPDLGDNDQYLPPVQALNRRGIVGNLVGYSIFGPWAAPDPSALIEAVERGDVDLGIAWGPIAGYFALHSAAPLSVVPIDPDPANPGLPMAFDIAIGVRPADGDLRQRLNGALGRHRPEIERLLKSYGISGGI